LCAHRDTGGKEDTGVKELEGKKATQLMAGAGGATGLHRRC
jgi:hypothetical protein